MHDSGGVWKTLPAEGALERLRRSLGPT
jgi:hypothetical protein